MTNWDFIRVKMFLSLVGSLMRVTNLSSVPKAIVMHDDERYRQKGYGVIRLKQASERDNASMLTMKMEKLYPELSVDYSQLTSD